MSEGALARIADCLRRGQLPDATDCVWLATAIEDWRTGSASSLDDACGVRRRPGRRTNKTRQMTEQRDSMLRDIARRFYPGLKPSLQAAAIVRVSSRYASAGWRRDRKRDRMPDCHTGTELGCYWQLLASGVRIPGARQLSSILSRQPGNQLPGIHFQRGDVSDSSSQ
jgi:hypothetical protein